QGKHGNFQERRKRVKAPTGKAAENCKGKERNGNLAIIHSMGIARPILILFLFLFVVKQGRKHLDPRYCTTEHGRGWRFKKSCFSYVSQPKTWAEAEELCVEKYKGHLVTILDYPVAIFLTFMFLQDVGEQIWIGIKTKKEYQQQWSSGWFVSYVNWHEDEEHSADEACAVRNKEGVWFTTSCSRNLPFVCEYSTAIPPQLKTTVENSYCPEKPPAWRDLGETIATI
ncbi:macrophage mannose receptor 1, partial [Caerostris extrusa]